jgi:hypothetical protein
MLISKKDIHIRLEKHDCYFVYSTLGLVHFILKSYGLRGIEVD